MTTVQEATQWIGVLGGLVTAAGVIITLLAFALRRAKQQQEVAAADRVLDLQKEEIQLLRERANRVPELEEKMKVLREEVGAAKAIAELKAGVDAGLVRLVELISHHEERARRADSWQQARFEALVEAQNELRANFHMAPVRVTPPGPEKEHRG